MYNFKNHSPEQLHSFCKWARELWKSGLGLLWKGIKTHIVEILWHDISINILEGNDKEYIWQVKILITNMLKFLEVDVTNKNGFKVTLSLAMIEIRGNWKDHNVYLQLQHS